MSRKTIILVGEPQRMFAHRTIDAAPPGAVVTVREATRSGAQNDYMWALLSDVANARPDGRNWTPETWKAAFMHALGHQCRFCEGLDNSGPFPLGFRSSRLTKAEMADMLTAIIEYGDRHGVKWTCREMEPMR